MPKLKTHSGAKKRFNLTASGKVKRAHAYKSHILTKKTTKRTRHLRATAYADQTNVSAIKEIRMSPSIDTNDFNTKAKAAQKFLADGNRVKVSVRFRGREMAHTNLGEKLLMDFAAACAEVASMEKNPKLEGRFMAIFLAPKSGK